MQRIPIASNLNRHGTVRHSIYNTVMQKTLRRQLSQLDFIEPSQKELDKYYVLELLDVVIKHYKDTNRPINSDKVALLQTRLSQRHGETSLLKDTEFQNFMQAFKEFIIKHPELVIREADNMYNSFIDKSRQIWHIIPESQFSDFFSPLYELDVKNIKSLLKRGGREDSKSYLQE